MEAWQFCEFRDLVGMVIRDETTEEGRMATSNQGMNPGHLESHIQGPGTGHGTDEILVDDFPNFPFGGSRVIMNHGSAMNHGP